ncbi:MAG: TolC family protein [Planctomycetota bacterium]
MILPTRLPQGISLCAALLLSACASLEPGPRPVRPVASPATSDEVPVQAGPAREAAPEPAAAELSWSEAWRAIQARDLGLRGLEAETRALEWEAKAAGIADPASMGLDIEDFAGQDDLRGLRGAQSTLWYSAPWQDREKLEGRAQVAQARLLALRAQHASRTRTLELQAREVFLEALGAQAQAELAADLAARLEPFAQGVEARVAGGKASELDRRQFEWARRRAALAAEQAQRERDQATRRLAALWAGTPRFERLAGELAGPQDGDLGAEANRLETPDWARADIESQLAVAQAEARQAGLERRRDLTWTVGLRRYEDSDSFAAMVGLEWPLVRRSAGRASEEAARARLVRAGLERDQANLDWSLEEAHQIAALRQSAQALRELQSGLLPEAEWSLETVQGGYRQGRFSMLEVLAAQDTWFELRAEELAWRVQYQLRLAQRRIRMGMEQ